LISSGDQVELGVDLTDIPLHLNSLSGSWLLKELIGKYNPNIEFFDDALALKSMYDYIAISKDNEHYSEAKAWNPIEGGDYVMLKDKLEKEVE